MTEVDLPFKVGDTVEIKSFESGYRGAWFICKITKIFRRGRGRALFYDLEYLDFPGEGIHTTKVFQKLEGESKNCLMIRPRYPRQCHENEDPNKEAGLEEAIVVHDVWKVGDLVDWWKDHCHWCGMVLEVRENESLKIELLPSPYGEEGIYDALSKDLRPSLGWSLEDGWTVPFSKSGEKKQCAKLMKLLTEDQVSRSESREEEEQRPTQSREEEKQRPTQSRKEEEKQRPTQSREEEKQRSTESSKEEKQRPSQKLEGDVDLRLNIMESESIEAAVLDLEELSVRLEWLKGMLRPSSSDNSYWKYEDYRPSSSII